MKFLIFASILALSSSCATKSKTSEPKKADGTCAYNQNSANAKVTNYEGMPDSATSTYAQSCADQGGEWKADVKFVPPTGTKGCQIAPSGAGATITTWYTGTSYVTTTVDCADQIPVTK